jgi:hypothetical protein
VWQNVADEAGMWCMKREDSHLSDHELIMAMDGELPQRDASRVDSHLAACWTCRSRRLELERSVADFVRVYQDSLTAPPATGPRAQLKAQLVQLSQAKPSWQAVLQLHFSRTGRIAAAAACCLGLIWLATVRVAPDRSAARAVTAPNPNLTPGAAVLMDRSEVCRDIEPNNKEVPVALRRRVFEEYGLAHAETRAYEVDYLITPALGGADDIRNLWPHSYTNTEWNAQVKDALESQLRNMVCDGRLDLTTAQRELATNWIGAYKKYFHTDRPITSVQ